MTDSFKKLKAEYFKRAVIFSCAGGVCGALIVVGALLLGFKLGSVNFFWALYIPVAIAVFALAGGLIFLFLRPTDVKVAKKLDKDNCLNEKIQTMIEYDGKEGEIVALQREDAALRLSSIKLKKPGIKFIVSSAVSCVLALTLFLTGAFIPAKADGNHKIEDPPFVITNWQETALNSLISDVRSSDLQTQTKALVIVSLEALLEMLKEEIPESEMLIAVESVMETVVNIASDANSYAGIAEQLSKDEKLKDYAEALTNGAKSYGAGKELTSYQAVLNKREIITSTVNELLSNLTEAQTEKFRDMQFATWRTEVLSLSNSMLSALEALESQYADDALYTAFVAYASDISVYVDASGYDVDKRKELVNTQGVTLAQDAGLALDMQSYTEMMCEYTRRRLASIFGITITEPPEENTDDNPGNNDDPGNSGGGGGHGGWLGGSDDIIFDTGAGEYVQYKEVLLTKYYPAVDAILASEDLPDELKARIREYFRVLQSVIEDENVSDNQ